MFIVGRVRKFPEFGHNSVQEGYVVTTKLVTLEVLLFCTYTLALEDLAFL
jgi:hypothetical protein